MHGALQSTSSYLNEQFDPFKMQVYLQFPLKSVVLSIIPNACRRVSSFMETFTFQNVSFYRTRINATYHFLTAHSFVSVSTNLFYSLEGVLSDLQNTRGRFNSRTGILPALGLANRTETAGKGLQDYLVFISHTGHYIIKGAPISAVLIPMKLAVHILRPPNSSFFQSPHKKFQGRH